MSTQLTFVTFSGKSTFVNKNNSTAENSQGSWDSVNVHHGDDVSDCCGVIFSLHSGLTGYLCQQVEKCLHNYCIFIYFLSRENKNIVANMDGNLAF